MLQVCEHSASEKGIKLEMNGDEILDAAVNPPLLEQALINLVENAIKYSDPKSLVSLSLENKPTNLLLASKIKDSGLKPSILKEFLNVFTVSMWPEAENLVEPVWDCPLSNISSKPIRERSR